MTEYNQFTIQFAQLILKIRDIRGKILDEVIFLEYALDLIILKYFCESTAKIELFQALLLNQGYFTLDSKITTFENLKLGDKYVKLVASLGINLRKAKNIRNYFAHHMIDNSEEAVLNKQLRLVYFERGKRKYRSINEEYLKQKLDWLLNIRTDLLVILMNADFSRSSDIDISVG